MNKINEEYNIETVSISMILDLITIAYTLRVDCSIVLIALLFTSRTGINSNKKATVCRNTNRKNSNFITQTYK